jgi:biotin-(acetyl-CoA carboxylase) ligase
MDERKRGKDEGRRKRLRKKKKERIQLMKRIIKEINKEGRGRYEKGGEEKLDEYEKMWRTSTKRVRFKGI